MSRAWKIVLGVSLALNLLLVGFLGGRMLRDGPPRPFVTPIGMAWMLQALPEARRDELMPMLKPHFQQIRPNLRAMRAAQADVERALTQPTFDPAEMRRALTAMHAQVERLEQGSQAALIALASRLSLEERKALAERLRRGPPWGGRHGHSGHMRPERMHDGPMRPNGDPEPPPAPPGAAAPAP